MANKLIICCKCNKIATWLHMPSDRAYCDEHVPRGCTCNVQNLEEDGEPSYYKNNIIWWDKKTYDIYHQDNLDENKFTTRTRQNDSFYYEILDEKGRRNPCCEYEYSEKGFEI